MLDNRLAAAGDATHAYARAEARAAMSAVSIESRSNGARSVDDHEIESEIAQNFRGVRGRRLDESADELLAGGEALAECGGMRTRRGRDHGAFPIRGSRGLVKNSRSFHTAKC